MHKQFVLVIYDSDVGNIVHTEILQQKKECYIELKNILLSFEKLPEDEEDLTIDDINHELSKFEFWNISERTYSYWLPGKHRLIHICYV